MVVMILIDHTSEYSLVSCVLLNSIARKGNIIGTATFNISLLMMSMAAGFVVLQLFYSIIDFFCCEWRI